MHSPEKVLMPENDRAQVKKNILDTLLYFDLFSYPLILPEIIRFLRIRITDLTIAQQALQELTSQMIVFEFGGYYSVQNDHQLIVRRKKGNNAALRIRGKAEKMAALIHRFPFVRSVNVSGSLSKGYFDETTDIDFFIITAPGRLWLCRTLLALYKKVFLLNSRKYFCINYFISSDSVVIPDRNLFTATEIITLQNLKGADVYNNFLEANSWTHMYFPNAQSPDSAGRRSDQPSLKRRWEGYLGGRIGNGLEQLSMKATNAFWKWKFRRMTRNKFSVNLRSGEDVSKHHPQGFQFKVLNAYEERRQKLYSNYSL
jgi:predicted nucleotidyltransferase